MVFSTQVAVRAVLPWPRAVDIESPPETETKIRPISKRATIENRLANLSEGPKAVCWNCCVFVGLRFKSCTDQPAGLDRDSL